MIDEKPILYDSHMHTPLCKHARGEPEAYAEQAEKRNLKGIIFTCHNPGPKGWSERIRMSLEQFDDYVAMVARARAAYAGRVDVRLGLECDYAPGMEDWLEKLLKKAEFHHLLGSIHPHAQYYKKAYLRNNEAVEFFATYFDHLALAAESGMFDTLSHPDLVKNVFPNEWEPKLVWDDILHSLDRIAKTGVAMELNTSGLNKKIKEMNPFPEMLIEMHKRDIPVVLGSDSHEPKRVSADFEQALYLLQESGFQTVSFFLDRKRKDVDIMTAWRSLRAVEYM